MSEEGRKLSRGLIVSGLKRGKDRSALVSRGGSRHARTAATSALQHWAGRLRGVPGASALRSYGSTHQTAYLPAFLPPLIFEAAINLRWSELKREMPVVLILATVSVLLSAAVTALGMHYIARWVWMSALVFGVLIAATDPVAVIATFKETRVHGRSRLLVEAESLFNDCTAAVAFTIVLGFAGGQGIGVLAVSKSFLVIVVGAIVCGVMVSFLCLLLAGATDDHLIEIAFTTVAAYGAFLSAEHFHTSGVLATLTAGLIMGTSVIYRSRRSRGRRGTVLGVCRVLHELVDLSADWNESRGAELQIVPLSGDYRNPASNARTRVCYLPCLSSLY